MSGKENEANFSSAAVAPPNYDGAPQQSGYPQQSGAPYPQQGGYAPYPPQQGVVNAGYAQPYPQQQPGYVYNAPMGAVTVVQAGAVNDVNDHCTWSIMTTIFCCFWIGIAAIIKSSSVRDAKMRGDRASAERLSNEARTLNRVGLGVGIAFNLIYIVGVGLYIGLVVVGSVTSYNSYTNCYYNYNGDYIC